MFCEQEQIELPRPQHRALKTQQKGQPNHTHQSVVNGGGVLGRRVVIHAGNKAALRELEARQAKPRERSSPAEIVDQQIQRVVRELPTSAE
jgi:hypothetical protein